MQRYAMQFLGTILLPALLIFLAATGLEGKITIDSFETYQFLLAEGDVPPGNTDMNSVTGPGIVMDERDVFIEVTEGADYLTLKINDADNGLLAHSQETGVKGYTQVVWDGLDGDPAPLAVDYVGLGGVDLTGSGALDHMMVHVTNEDWPATLVVSVYTDSANWSNYIVNLPGLISPPGIKFYLNFSDFVVQSGTGADFTNVGAIVMEIIGSHNATDLTIESIEAVTSSIGDYVWYDADAEGDQDEAPSIYGLNGVTVDLYEDLNCNGVADIEDALLDSRTTDYDPDTGNPGWYLFTNLESGCYVVDVDESTLPPGYILTTANEPHPKDLALGENYREADFGYWCEPTMTPTYVPTETPYPSCTPTPQITETPTTLPCLIYAVHDEALNDSQFFTIDPYTSDVNALGPLHIDQDIEGLDIHPVTNRLYASSGSDGEYDGYLFNVDAVTGDMTMIGDTGFSEVVALTFRWFDAALWGWSEGSGLISIDINTGAASLVYGSSINVEGLAWNHAGTTLYASSGTNLYAYDPLTNTMTHLASNLPGETEALEMRPDNYLWAGIHESDDSLSIIAYDVVALHTVDELSLDTIYSDVESIAYPEYCDVPEIPTPTPYDTPVPTFTPVMLGIIGDFVWHDMFHSQTHQVDGLQDAGEPGIEGVQVLLLDAVGDEVDSVVTASDGSYYFFDVPAGDYTVKIADVNFQSGGVLEGWYASPQDRGTNDEWDSDGDESTHEADVHLDAGEYDFSIDFGFFQTCIDIEKTGPEFVYQGESITYHFRLENCGDIVHHGGAQVYDPMIDPDNPIWDGMLWPGQVVEFDRTVNLIGTGFTMDFEFDDDNIPLYEGQFIDEQWADLGIHLTTSNPASHPLMIFNSSAPTGGDPDLGTPNQDFGGPGIGNGGKMGMPGENSIPQDYVLIISRDANPYDPDDYAGGGVITAYFDQPMSVREVQVLDIDNNEYGGEVRAFDELNNVIAAVPLQNYGDNSFQAAELNALNAARLEIEFASSAGLAMITFNACGDVINTATAVGHPKHPDGYYLDNVYDESQWTVDVICATPTPMPTDTPTPVPTDTPSPVPTDTFTPVPTDTPTPVPTDTFTCVPTETPTPVPTDTFTCVPTDTPTPVPTNTFTCVPTDTPTPVPTDTFTPLPTNTPTPEPTLEPSPSPEYTCVVIKRGELGDITDTTLWKKKPGSNFGTLPKLYTGFYGYCSEFRALMQFDLSVIPEGAFIESATLSLFSLSSVYSKIVIHRMTDAWEESTATWCNSAQDFSPYVEAVLFAGAPGFHSVDLTDLVQLWMDYEYENYGIMLKHHWCGYNIFKSSDSDCMQRRPMLEVCYRLTGPPPTPTFLPSLTPTIEPTLTPTIEPTLTPTIPLPSPTPEYVCITISRDGLGDAADTFISRREGNYNYGNSTYLYAGRRGQLLCHYEKRMLLWFDISVLPPDAVIDYAHLHIYSCTAYNGTACVHRITEPWYELEVTWNNFGNAFDPVNEDCFNTALSGYHTADITTLVQRWFGGVFDNYGVMIDETLNGYDKYISSEYYYPEQRPLLEICYWIP